MMKDSLDQGRKTAKEDQWLLGVTSVLFDIDQGQTIENLYPPNALSPEEQRAVAFHSFPDSMSMELHSRSSIRDSTFFFRILREGVTENLDPSTSSQAEQSAQSNQSSKPEQKKSPRQHYHNQDQEYIYGFAFCRQRQDNSLRRGGEQKSLVLLSLHPYSHVLSQLRQWAGPLYFNYGASALREIYEEVLEWGPPIPSSRKMLHAGSMTIFAQVPHPFSMPPPWSPGNMEEISDMELEIAVPPLDTLQGCFGEVDVFTPFKSILDKLHAIWELAILAQPMFIIAPSPGECSAAVGAILALLAPLPYSADFRPYYTIHDSTFNQLLVEKVPNSVNGLPRLLGVTNLYFLKALPQWPNVISLGSKPSQPSHANGNEGQSRIAKAVQRKGTGFKSLLTTYTEAAWLNHKPLTKTNKQLLERLLKFQGGDGPERLSSIASTNSNALKRHFNELTVALLQPFEAYIQARPPPPGNSPLPEEFPESHTVFSHSDFLKSIERPDTIAPIVLGCFNSKANCLQFYRQFLESPNFASWFERRRGRAALWQECAWKQAELERGREFKLENIPETQLVETFQNLELKLSEAQENGNSDSQSSTRRTKLTEQLREVYRQMPRDLQACMLSSPARAALLQRNSSNPRLVPGHLKVSHG